MECLREDGAKEDAFVFNTISDLVFTVLCKAVHVSLTLTTSHYTRLHLRFLFNVLPSTPTVRARSVQTL